MKIFHKNPRPAKICPEIKSINSHAGLMMMVIVILFVISKWY